MKNLLRFLGITVFAAVIVFGAASCGDGGGGGPSNPVDNKPTTYTVWTDSGPYSEFESAFGSLADGYYVRMELTNSEFNDISPSLTDEYKHTWTENELYNWFIGRGFGSTEANQQKAWLISINHGLIASRSGSIVYMLIK